MPRPRHWLIHKSRDRDFLLRAALAIGAAGIASGLVLAKLRPGEPDAAELVEELRAYCPWLPESSGGLELRERDLAAMRRLLAIPEGEAFSPEDLAKAVRRAAYDAANAFGIPAQVLESDRQRALFWEYGYALHRTGKRKERALSALREAVGADPPARFAHEFYGDVLWREGEAEAALEHFRSEVASHPQAAYSRFGIMSILLQLERFGELENRFDDPEYRAALTDHLEVEIASHLGRWGTVILTQAKIRFTQPAAAWLVVAGFSALVWFSIVATLGGVDELRSRRLGLYGLGFLAGAISTLVTIAVVIWQDTIQGFGPNGDLANDLIYCISGIGLREELVKLLLFAPFLPILLKRGSAMEALATAGCVGLGFAAVENLGYFERYGGGAVFGRFLTANILHVSLTGLAGLALFHFARWPKTRWEEFVGTFLVIVVAHGVYDALSGLAPALAHQYSLFGIIIFALVCNRYLNQARELHEGGTAVVSPLGTFVVGTALLVAITWAVACMSYPLPSVMASIGEPALSVAVIGFLFINQFRGY